MLKALQATQTSATLAVTSNSPGNSAGVVSTGWEVLKNLPDYEVPQSHGLEALRNKPMVQLPPVLLLSQTRCESSIFTSRKCQGQLPGDAAEEAGESWVLTWAWGELQPPISLACPY